VSAQTSSGDPQREAWRRALRRAALYSYGLFAAAVVVSLAGAALIAWLLTRVGFPFVATWLTVAAVMLLIPLIALGLRALRGGGGGG
jgi:ABC-type Fe3+ transport system permease subunit